METRKRPARLSPANKPAIYHRPRRSAEGEQGAVEGVSEGREWVKEIGRSLRARLRGPAAVDLENPIGGDQGETQGGIPLVEARGEGTRRAEWTRQLQSAADLRRGTISAVIGGF